MKKSIYLLVAIILSSINFISCQKENEFVTENKNSTFTITSENIGYVHNECLEDLINQLRSSMTNTSLDYIPDKMKIKWNRLAKTQEDRYVIFSTCNVAKASTDYWTDNYSKWNISKIEKSSFRTVCGALIGADCACIAELMWMSAIGVLVADKIALVCVGTSLSAGIGQAVNDLIVNWPTRNALGESFSYQDYQELILNARIKAIKSDPTLNQSL